jgi:hypothetical protein
MGSVDTTNNEAYTLQPIPGKGKGLIATRAISRGELILSDLRKGPWSYRESVA